MYETCLQANRIHSDRLAAYSVRTKDWRAISLAKFSFNVRDAER